MRRLVFGVAAAVAVASMILVAAACGDDDDDDSGDGHGADAAGLVAAIAFLDGLGLHGIDDSINVDGEIPAGAVTAARKAQAVMALAEWPEDLRAEASALEAIFAEMVDVLDAEEPDMAAARDVAARAHDSEHDFSSSVWGYLYREAGIEGGGGGH